MGHVHFIVGRVVHYLVRLGPTTIVATILPVVLGGEELVPRTRGKNAVRTSIIMTVPVTDILRFVMRIPFNPIGIMPLR